MKRLVFCFDGTWNRLDATTPTNVVLTAESVTPTGAKGTSQLIYYDQGVGTAKGDYLRGGIFGIGVDRVLGDAYRFLIFNHSPGDEIYVFGFSRGAYTARSFVGLLRNCGIVRRRDAARTAEAIGLYRSRALDRTPDHKTMNEFRRDACPDICVSSEEDEWRTQNVDGYQAGDAPILEIAYLGIWDTVGALGVPASLGTLALKLNRKYQFHDTRLTPRVRSARHAVAIDERRRSFAPSLWDNLSVMNELRGTTSAAADAPYQQKWFPGTHGSVGGGGDRRGLSDQALDWVWDGARHAGLELDAALHSRVFELAPSYREALDNMSGKPGLAARLMAKLPKIDRGPRPQTLHELSVSAKRRWHEAADRLPERRRYRPPTLGDLEAALSRFDSGLPGAARGAVAGLDVPGEGGGFTLHEVALDETLGSIAKQYYGDASRWPDIYAANADKLSDPDRVYCGQMLRIPAAVEVPVAPAGPDQRVARPPG